MQKDTSRSVFSINRLAPPGFPTLWDMHHPMRNHPECSNENRDFDRYLEFMFGQIKELLTNMVSWI